MLVNRRDMSSGGLTLSYMNQSPLNSVVVLIKNYEGVQIDLVLGEIQLLLLLSLLQQTQVAQLFP